MNEIGIQKLNFDCSYEVYRYFNKTVDKAYASEAFDYLSDFANGEIIH